MVLIVLVSFIGKRLASIAFHRDWLFGMAKIQADSVGRADACAIAARQFEGELDTVPGYNKVVRGQLNGVVSPTRMWIWMRAC